MCSFGDDDTDDDMEQNNKILNPQVDIITDAETQFMDGYGTYDAETQGICLAGETQALCFDGETQAVDHVVDCAEGLCTQLFDDTEIVVDTDEEGTKKTDVLSDTEAFSDVDSGKRIDGHTVGKMLQTGRQKQNRGEFKDLLTTGSVLEGFTSLRVASIRSSGLAARNMSLKQTNNTSYSNMGDSKHEAESSGTSVINSSYKVLGQIDQRHNLQESDDKLKGSSSENKFRVGKSAVRKLFNEDVSHEKGLDININNTDKEENFPPVCSSEMELAGLSYVNSQEPGEASQSIALDFVDKFLKFNVIESDQEADITKSTGGKSKPLSGAKGTQSLAKRANHIRSASGGTFDWDDYQEDEGGGEFFRKKKDAFLDDGRRAHQSFPQPWDSKGLNLKNRRLVEESDDKVEQQDISSNVAGLYYSDSKLLLHEPKKIDKSMKVAGKSNEKNLIKKLNDARDEIVETGTNNNNPDMLDVGVDTQLAADAMEALCYGVGLNDQNSNFANQDAEIHLPRTAKEKHRKKSEPDKIFVQNRALGSAVTTKQSNRTKRSGLGLTGSTILSEQQSINIRKQCDETEDMCNLRCELIDESMNEKELEGVVIGEHERCLVAALSGKETMQKRRAKEQLGTYLPIACRTRQKASNLTLKDTKTSTVLREGIDNLSAPIAPKRKRSRTALNALAREKCTELKFIQPGHLKETKVSHIELSDSQISGTSTVRRVKVHHKLSKEEISRNSKINFTQMKSGLKRKILASGVSDPASRQRHSRLEDTSVDHNPSHQNAIGISEDLAVFKDEIAEFTVGKSYSANTASEDAKVNPGSRVSPKSSAYMTPKQCTTPINESSPICMGKEYQKQSSRKKLSRSPLKKEVCRIIEDRPESAYKYKDLRKRRDITQVQVLFSQHLDGDIIKQQKKVLFRLGASIASSISDATHFVTDEFVRTRNMLEAIAYAKPVVTHFWLESCAQTSCLLDERNYILRDAKKEKEIGFSLPVSLARACQHPLLQGCRVLITHNTKPGKDILASLVKAVHGTAVERIGHFAPKDEFPSDLIVLSCEEDYADCVPFLKKGASIYSSELLLNGIVIQKLEYERHQLFAENVKKMCSTVRLRKDGEEFVPMAKCK